MLLGFDIGGTKCAVIKGIKENEQIKIIDRQTIPTERPAYEMIEFLFSTAESLINRHSISKHEIGGIGISCGSPLSSKRGVVLSPPNLPGWDNIPIVEMCNKRFGKHSFLQNDANAGAIAEWKYGAGIGYQNIIFLTFGTGMGLDLFWMAGCIQECQT